MPWDLLGSHFVALRKPRLPNSVFAVVQYLHLDPRPCRSTMQRRRLVIRCCIFSHNFLVAVRVAFALPSRPFVFALPTSYSTSRPSFYLLTASPHRLVLSSELLTGAWRTSWISATGRTSPSQIAGNAAAPYRATSPTAPLAISVAYCDVLGPPRALSVKQAPGSTTLTHSTVRGALSSYTPGH